jgi:hypothetical protein
LDLCLSLLPYAAFGMGLVAALFGVVGLVRGKLPFTHNKVLTGTSARIAGGASIILGILMIAYTVLMIRWFPESWGH